jgi:hypothetical protein
VTQISRPFQVALAAVALLGLVWAVALHGHAPGHGESTGSVPSAPSPSPSPSAKAQEKAAGTPTPIYHGAAPGVEGLTRAIAKAHEAVGTSQRNAQQLQQRSREASQEAPSAHSGASAAHPVARHAATAQRSAATARHAREAATAHARQTAARAHRQAGPGPGASAKHAAADRPAAQVAVEREVAAGKTVLLLFWTPQSSVDREVRAQTAAMVARSHGKLALHVAAPAQVGEFGSVTEVVHVYQTPTILIVNRRGVVSTLTGLTDTFALAQIVREAERANG